MLIFQVVVAGGKYYCPGKKQLLAGNPKLLPRNRGELIVGIGEQNIFRYCIIKN